MLQHFQEKLPDNCASSRRVEIIDSATVKSVVLLALLSLGIAIWAQPRSKKSGPPLITSYSKSITDEKSFMFPGRTQTEHRCSHHCRTWLRTDFQFQLDFGQARRLVLPDNGFCSLQLHHVGTNQTEESKFSQPSGGVGIGCEQSGVHLGGIAF